MRGLIQLSLSSFAGHIVMEAKGMKKLKIEKKELLLTTDLFDPIPSLEPVNLLFI